MTDLIATAEMSGQIPSGWQLAEAGDALTKTFQFANFISAFGWMTQMAMIAEKMNHHPEWRNVYRTVEVTLTTHDAGGVTAKDIALAQKMNEAAGNA
ncbi:MULTISPECIES: 4a-hydroxytetrahydrobiopterin dehydratase [Pacificibacter]|uniref:4a-hydroxytetrahydrobiopterin dehydratase n=1 Tax=Pacificibacter TaxID=1042323 RepID=UPI001C088EBC|nr:MULTISPECIES: 4a-hydroxytetrahydrobiopterin dehydratase [Pacificibacter]MBU2937310.1 4a-hydroxytetrahydrobiopterin dehydratase [Pacificibacter marinus]MDO6615305.1 4a-hydroxytetrahydrobiopterin dehydratase [Pacificibacter sp. 1_MG-2023]